MTHRCHALGCKLDVPPRMLFCAAHWRMLPPPVQARVWRLYVPGQERRKDPSAAYLAAQSFAVGLVALAEGRPAGEMARCGKDARYYRRAALMAGAADPLLGITACRCRVVAAEQRALCLEGRRPRQSTTSPPAMPAALQRRTIS